jgi:hypothetical protein
MNRRVITIVAAVAVVVVLALGGAAWAVAGGRDDGPSATGPQAERARAAALAITHGGTANAIERDGEDGATWEVEVTKPDGVTVDVRLDARYRLVVIDGDSEQDDGQSGDG